MPPRHRPVRRFPDAERRIVPCELMTCPHCGMPLRSRKLWSTRKYVQTLSGPLFVAGRSKKCINPECPHKNQHYYASQMSLISLPKSTYGLDVLAFIGWQHEHEHKQLVEVQQELNRRGILVNERNVGKLYRQFLGLLGAPSEVVVHQLEEVVTQQGGLIYAVDALQPEGSGTLLYVLYEELSGTVIAAKQLAHPSSAELCQWLQPYQAWPYPVLATISDGEEAIANALQTLWPKSPHQRCQSHFLGNLAEDVLVHDAQLRKQLREDLGGLPTIPEPPPATASSESGIATTTASISPQGDKASFFFAHHCTTQCDDDGD